MRIKTGVNEIAPKKTGEKRFVGRYFNGYSLSGKRIYTARTFATKEEACHWYTERKSDASLNPAAITVFPERWARRSFSANRHSAMKRSIPFAITLSDYEAMLARAAGRCMVTGIKFEFQASNNKSRRRPFAPSLDRIDPTLGYTVDNCRIICSALNYALGDWGMEPLLRIARRLVARESELMKNERRRLQTAA